MVSVVSATGTGCATATGVAPIAVPKPATTRTAARAHPVTAVRPIRIASVPDSTEVVGTTSVGARALIVVEHLSGSPR